MMEVGRITVSIVSHGQSALVQPLLCDLRALANSHDLEILLTNNIKEARIDRLPLGVYGKIITNEAPLGFGENHNNAFRASTGEFFCVLNPDIRISGNPFPALVALSRDPSIGLVAPAIVSPAGALEDSARQFPTPLGLLRRVLSVGDQGTYAYRLGEGALDVDFLAGMFILARADVFRKVCGFDERYFLYFEDVDLSARLWSAGLRVVLCPSVSAVHDAQRASRRKARFLRMHIVSCIRYLARWWLRAPVHKCHTGARR